MRVGALGQVLGLADHPSPPAPAVAGGIEEVLAAGLPVSWCSASAQASSTDRVDEPAVAGQAEEVIDAQVLAPGHQLLAGAAGVGAEQDPHLGPAPADAGDEARHLVLGAGRGVDVRAPELRRQQLPAENVERQITPAVVVAVEEPAFGGRARDRRWRRPAAVRIEEHVDEHVLPRLAIAADLVIAVAAAPGACSSRFIVLLPASGAQSLRSASRLSPNNASTGSKRNLSWSLTSSYPSAMATMRWPTSVGSAWMSCPGSRPSLKHAATRPISPIARSVSRSNTAPASDVTAPPSNAATTRRPSNPSNSSWRYTLSASDAAPESINPLSQKDDLRIPGADAPASVRYRG